MADTFAVRIVNVTPKKGWNPHITRHAILRYLERVWDIPEKKLLKPFLNDAVRRAIILGAEKVRLPDCTLVLKGNSIVTVLEKPGKGIGGRNKSPRRAYRQCTYEDEL